MKLFAGSVVVLWLAFASSSSGTPQTESIPSPAEFHGYELGTTYTITANLYEYYRELARKSESPGHRGPLSSRAESERL